MKKLHFVHFSAYFDWERAWRFRFTKRFQEIQKIYRDSLDLLGIHKIYLGFIRFSKIHEIHKIHEIQKIHFEIHGRSYGIQTSFHTPENFEYIMIKLRFY